jgi:hypothetical protein
VRRKVVSGAKRACRSVVSGKQWSVVSGRWSVEEVIAAESTLLYFNDSFSSSPTCAYEPWVNFFQRSDRHASFGPPTASSLTTNH